MPETQVVASSESTQQTQEQQQQQAPTPKPQSDSENGAGSKREVLAELAAERDKRQELANQIETLKTGMAKALGLATDEVTPEQLAKELEQSKSETSQMQLQLAVFTNAPAGVDVQALLDSSAFQRELATQKLSKDSEIKTFITEYVTANPRFRTTPTGGVKDLHAGNQTGAISSSMDAFIRTGRR